MTDDALFLVIFVSGGFLGLAVVFGAMMAAEWVRSFRFTSPEDVRRRGRNAGAGAPSRSTMQAERQRQAFERIMADLKREAEHDAKVRDSLDQLGVHTADEMPRRSSR